MILAAGLTPAWQQIMRFSTLRIGEVNRAVEVEWCASGKVINVGLALGALGVPSHTLSPAGGWTGEAMRAEFAPWRQDSNLADSCTRSESCATWIPTQTPTRVCTTILDEVADATTELVENAAPLTDAERDDFVTRYQRLSLQAELVVLTGSLPRGTPAAFYRELLRRTPCPVVLDARGPELAAALECKPRVVKPNREELALTVGRPLPDRASVLEAMRELIERGARSVIVTQGKSVVWVTEGAQTWELTPPEVHPVVNPIGCGDCFAAGVAWGLARGDSLLEAAQLGIAAAAENVTHLLPARLSVERVERWRGRIAPAVYV